MTACMERNRRRHATHYITQTSEEKLNSLDSNIGESTVSLLINGKSFYDCGIVELLVGVSIQLLISKSLVQR